MMELETLLSKYIPIFNWLGESCVMTSDFQLTSHSSIKRRVSYILIFISFSLTPLLFTLNTIMSARYFNIKTHMTRIVFLIILICIVLTKLLSIVHLSFWLNNLPKMYRLIKDLQLIIGTRYQMDFQQFHNEFIKKMILISSIFLIRSIIISVFHNSSVVNFNEAAALSFNDHVSFFHVYFYVSLFKNLISFYINYLEHKVLFDKPKTLSEVKAELNFIKCAHFKLFEISKILNAAFGWIFVSMAVQKFTEVTGALFYMFLRVECNKFSTGMRNY